VGFLCQIRRKSALKSKDRALWKEGSEGEAAEEAKTGCTLVHPVFQRFLVKSMAQARALTPAVSFPTIMAGSISGANPAVKPK